MNLPKNVSAQDMSDLSQTEYNQEVMRLEVILANCCVEIEKAFQLFDAATFFGMLNLEHDK